jgi:UDP-glucose 4-epimerase
VKAVVTGGAGFIGGHLCRRLLTDGWEVVAVDNLSSGSRRNVPEGVELVEADLTEEATGELLPTEIDVVFHLASHVGQELSFERPVYDLRANAVGTGVVLEWMRGTGVEKIVFASTMNVYGDPPEELVTEQSPLRPPSPYAVGKIASELMCGVYEEFGIRSTSLRLFNVYGPMQDMRNMKQGMVSIFMAYVARGEPVLVRGPGERFRDFIWVQDVVDAFTRCASEPDTDGRVYNVSTGRKTLVRELLREITSAFGHEPDEYPIAYGDPTPRDQFGLYGDSSALRTDTGWRPATPLEEGIPMMAAWVREGDV